MVEAIKKTESGLADFYATWLRASRNGQGNVKVALSRLEIPLNLPLQKGDFLFPILKKWGK